MPVNDKLLAAIASEKLRNSDKEAERKAALDALLAVKPSDLQEFRKAVIAHGAFWAEMDIALDTAPGAKDDDENYLNSADPVNTFTKIQQAVAEQRVKLGLDAVDDTDTFLLILKYNTEECRAYLGNRTPSIKKAGWEPDKDGPPSKKPARNDSKEILTDEAIKSIKQQAASLLLVSLIEQAEDLTELDNLATSADDAQFKTAAAALKFPAGNVDALDNSQFFQLRQKAAKRIEELKQEAGLDAFNKIVRELDDAWILSKKDILETAGGKAFFDKFIAEFKDTTPSLENIDPDIQARQGEQTQQKLCERYLQAVLLKEGLSGTPQEQASVLNAENKAVLEGLLKPKIAGHDTLIGFAVSEENLAAFKITLLKNVISKMNFTDAETLIKAGNLAALKEKLAPILGNDSAGKPVSLDFLKTMDDFRDIRKVVESRYALTKFEILLNKHSSLGKWSHTQLMEAFKKLPFEKQLEINKNEKELHFLVNTQDKQVLKYYLGKGIEDSFLDSIVEENKKNVLYKQIHNSAIAQVLAGFHPPLNLDERHIEKINEILLKNKNNTFDDSKQGRKLYGKLLNDIYQQCLTVSPVDRNNFFGAFGRNPDNSINPLSPVRRRISDLHDNNKPLFEWLATAAPNVPPAHKELVNVLLRMANGYLDKGKITTILETFDKSTSIHAFIASTTQSPGGELAGLERQLTRDFAKDEFMKLKAIHRAYLFQQTKGTDNAPIEKAIEQLEAGLKTLQKTTEDLLKHSDSLSAIDSIDDSYAPSFKGKSQREIILMEKQYKALDDECLDIIDHLIRASKELESQRFASLPAEVPPPGSPEALERDKLRERAAQFKIDLDDQQRLIAEEIARYTAIHEKISKNVLPVIRGQLADTHKTVFMSTGVRIYRQSRTEAVKRGSIIDDADSRVIAQGKVGARSALETEDDKPDRLFARTGKPSADEVICFDTNREVTNNTGKPPTVNLKGRFTYDASPPDAVRASTQGIKPNPGRYEVIEFPTAPKGSNISQKDLEDERVKFAMTMATQALANMNRTPSAEHPIKVRGIEGKEEEARYLWTALVVLGVKPEAIEMRGTANFNPKDEKGYVGTFGSKSLHDTVFKSRSEIVNGYVKQLEKEGTHQASVAQVDTQVQKSMRESVKEARDQIRKDVAEKQEKEGLTPEAAALRNDS